VGSTWPKQSERRDKTIQATKAAADAPFASLSSAAKSAQDPWTNPSGGLMAGVSQETQGQQKQTKAKADLPSKPLVSSHTRIC